MRTTRSDRASTLTRLPLRRLACTGNNPSTAPCSPSRWRTLRQLPPARCAATSARAWASPVHPSSTRQPGVCTWSPNWRLGAYISSRWAWMRTRAPWCSARATQSSVVPRGVGDHTATQSSIEQQRGALCWGTGTCTSPSVAGCLVVATGTVGWRRYPSLDKAAESGVSRYQHCRMAAVCGPQPGHLWIAQVLSGRPPVTPRAARVNPRPATFRRV
jgi:hypothetical protein